MDKYATDRHSDLIRRVLDALRAEAGDQAVSAVLERVAKRLMTESRTPEFLRSVDAGGAHRLN